MYNLSIWGCTHTAREAYSLCTREAQVWLCSWENLIRKTSYLMSYLYFESCPSQELPQAPRLAFSCNNVFLRAIDLVLVLKLNLFQIILLEKPVVEGACPTIKTRKEAGKHSLKVGPPMAPVQSICWIFVFDRTYFLPRKKNRIWGESKVILPCQFVIEIGHKAFLARRCVEYLFDPLHLGWVKSHLKASRQVNLRKCRFC